MKKLAIVTQLSNNRKTGPCSATYVAQQSCPASCPLRNAGCYAEKGRVGIHTRRLNAGGGTALEIARAEAEGIRKLKAFGQALRLHVVGDCKSEKTAEIVSEACRDFVKRGGGSPWSYTHAWRRVARKAWEGVSILASIHRIKDGLKALARGYAPAIVVEEFPQGKAWKEEGVTWIPCPAQLKEYNPNTGEGIQCVDCRLCWNADRLHKNKQGIAFAKH